MTLIVDRKLWLDSDGNLVEDGDPNAAILWHTPGDEITEDDASEVGYKDGAPKPDEDGDQPDVKIGDVAPNKAVDAPEADKAKKAPAKRTRKAAKKAT